tara:strand:+ start:6568 stop:7860 length:1293 start_codon:yes stop_codon:yes gene_type:complete
MVNREKQYDNSFTLRFSNSTNSRRKVILFEQGNDTAFSVRKVNSVDENASQGNIITPPLIWNFYSSQPFVYREGVGGTIIFSITEPIDTSNLFSQANGNLVLEVQSGSTLNVPILESDNINQVNDKINAEIRANGDLTNFRSPSGQFTEVNVFFDVSYFESFPLPQNATGTAYRGAWGVSIQYPTDMPNGTLLRTLNFPNNVNPEFQGLDLLASQLTSSANGVVVDDSGSNVTYDEILRSQNGAVYDIISMSLDIGSTPTSLEAKSQMLQPLCYDKRDANGDSITYCQVPTIDPYQFQNSFSVIDMASDSDNYVLDGQTEFVYELEPLSTALLTFNYTKLTNLVGDTKMGIATMRKEQEKIKEWDAKRQTKSTKTLYVKPIAKNKKLKNFSNFSNETETKNEKNSINTRAIGVLVGLGFLFFIYSLNQTN